VRRLARSPEPLDVLADPRGSLRALGRGKTATASLFWSNWCGPGARPTGDHGRIPAAILLRLPGGTTLALALTQAPRCDAPQAPSILAVAPFTPAVRTMPPSSRLPLRAAIAGPRPVTVKAGLRGFRVPRGALLRYQLALTNPSRRSFRFGASCPVYVEQLVPSVPARAYILNCRPAGAIAAGATALFEVLLPVPAGARLGSNGLSIELAPRTYEPPFATAAVYIIR
jgi:hypothetical protein